MKTKSGKAKARKLQDWVRDALYERFEFTKDDIRCALMGESGEDIKLTSLWPREDFLIVWNVRILKLIMYGMSTLKLLQIQSMQNHSWLLRRINISH